MDHDSERGRTQTGDRATLRDTPVAVRSIQWLDQPQPAARPDRRWRAALALAGATAFTLGMAVITDGFQPVTVTPAPGAISLPQP